jgi:hypothetical protein
VRRERLENSSDLVGVLVVGLSSALAAVRIAQVGVGAVLVVCTCFKAVQACFMTATTGAMRGDARLRSCRVSPITTASFNICKWIGNNL